MPRTRIALGDRQRIVDSFTNGEDFVALANHLGIRRTTAYSIVRCFQTTGRIETIQRGGRSSLIDNETVDFIIMLIEDNPLYTLRSLVSEVREVFPTKPFFSVTTLSRALEVELISLKLVHDIPAERNSDRIKAARKTYAQWMVEQGIQKHLVYIDETGFNLWTKRTFGRGRVGDRVNRQVGGQRGRNVTVIAAISDIGGLFYYEIHFTSVTKEIFSGFIASVDAILGDDRPTVILDNAPIHNGIMEVYPNIDFKYLPAYSPFLNPIENCFSVFKTYLKQYLHSEALLCTTANAHRLGITVQTLREQTLRRGVELTLPQVTLDVIARNYIHANRYLVRCINEQSIFD